MIIKLLLLMLMVGIAVPFHYRYTNTNNGFEKCLNKYNLECNQSQKEISNVLKCTNRNVMFTKEKINEENNCLNNVKYVIIDKIKPTLNISKISNAELFDISYNKLSSIYLKLILNLKQLKRLVLTDHYLFFDENQWKISKHLEFVVYRYNNPYKGTKFIVKKCFNNNELTSTYVNFPIPIYFYKNFINFSNLFPFISKFNSVSYFDSCSHSNFFALKKFKKILKHVRIYDNVNCLTPDELNNLKDFKSLKFLEIDQMKFKLFDFVAFMKQNPNLIMIMYKVEYYINTIVTNKCDSIEICSYKDSKHFACELFTLTQNSTQSNSEANNYHTTDTFTTITTIDSNNMIENTTNNEINYEITQTENTSKNTIDSENINEISSTIEEDTSTNEISDFQPISTETTTQTIEDSTKVL